jgi:thiosulfate/3-mercaptopyruvate sulfurtransferase
MIVDAQWVRERLDDPGVAILDARPPAEFSGETPGEGIGRPGHIPGARNVFWQTLVRSPDDARLKDETELRRMFEEAGAAPGDTVVAYCRTGGQASFLYTVARHLGYDVRLYDGSYVDWSRTEYPVER